MQRRGFVAWTSAALAAGFSLELRQARALARGVAEEPTKDGSIFGGPPVLQSPASDAITVFQGVRGLSTGWVEYGTTASLGERADTMRHGLLPLNGLVQRVRLTGLKPDTTYHYRVGVAPIDFRGAYKITRGPDQFSPVHSFRTLSDEGRRASFLVINDTHENMETLRGLSAQIAAARRRHADASLPSGGPLFWNGDIFDDVRNDQQIAANVLTPPIAVDAPGAELGYASQAPMCFVSGNHDVRGIHARSLDMFVDTPGGLRYAIIRHGPIAFVVLDTGEDKPDAHGVYAGLGAFEAYRAQQGTWLDTALRDPRVQRAACRIVIQHIPMFGGGSCEGARQHWAKRLADAKVTAVISGHTHHYAFSPAGPEQPFAQLVGGGPAPEAATLIEGVVDGTTLTLTVRGLDGAVRGVHEVPVAG
ncbi:MAG: metallophosphoesterase family protein [Phycisphaerae bacterium]|nr:metallophosphoesterase family protein [Phycisphaerae bacterium]